jgi:hypothetical protein
MSACGPREESEVFRAPQRERVGWGPARSEQR